MNKVGGGKDTNFFHFMQFLEKFWPNNRSAPPPSGKLWIPHCLENIKPLEIV